MIPEQLQSARFLSAFRYHASVSSHFQIQQSHLLYKISGSSRYYEGDRTFTTHPGDVLLIPEGAAFRTTLLEEGDYAIIYFETKETLSDKIVTFPFASQYDMAGLFLTAASLWIVKNTAVWYLCQAKLYEIIGHLMESEQRGSLRLSEQQILRAPVNYMKKHLFETSFSLSEVYSLSGVSEPYFRHLFCVLYGMPPKRYVLTARINRARYLLLTEPSLRLQEVAEAVGYTDAFHFSKTFKKETGISPEGFRKNRA